MNNVGLEVVFWTILAYNLLNQKINMGCVYYLFAMIMKSIIQKLHIVKEYHDGIEYQSQI